MNVTSHTAACRIPKLDPFHPHAMKLVEDLSDPLRCKTEQRATLSGGVLNITGKQHYTTYCNNSPGYNKMYLRLQLVFQE